MKTIEENDECRMMNDDDKTRLISLPEAAVFAPEHEFAICRCQSSPMVARSEDRPQQKDESSNLPYVLRANQMCVKHSLYQMSPMAHIGLRYLRWGGGRRSRPTRKRPKRRKLPENGANPQRRVVG